VDLSDEALIDNFRATKDACYFHSLVIRYQDRMYNAAFRMLNNYQEAEEVVQEALMRILQNLDGFRNQASFAAWIFKIVHNLCIDILRAKQRRGKLGMMAYDPQSVQEASDLAEVHVGVVSQIADSNPGPAQRLDDKEQQEIIATSLGQLPEPQRAVIVLHDIEGFSYQEIAEIVGTNIGTVRSRLHYGRTRLREMLNAYFQSNAIASYPR